MTFSVSGWQKAAPAAPAALTQLAEGCSPHPHNNPTPNTRSHITWSDHRCAHAKCAHICKKHSALTCLLSGLLQPHTHIRGSRHAAPLLRPTPPPRSKQPPSGLVRANPALDSGAPIAAPPLLRVVREMKALGVHYKTTTAAAGDRPPGATSFAFPSFHLQLLLFFSSFSFITVTSSAFSPLSRACSRCHTHPSHPRADTTIQEKYSIPVKWS